MPRTPTGLTQALHGCSHEFAYGGVKFEVSNRPIPGSGAYLIKYFDCYFCKKCLEKKFEQLDITHDSYQTVRFGATPKK